MSIEPADTHFRATRLAPSPTGALHLGNARTFLITWLIARSRGWTIHLRVEDLDGPRIKAGADRAAIEDLEWLGLDWDSGPIYQRDRRERYTGAIAQLLANGRAYPCTCTRAEVEQAASAPHADDGATVYPGTCRDRYGSVDAARRASGREPAIRFRVDESRNVRWSDGFAGEQSIALASLGDFVIAKADGTAAYQLAVVIDDAAAGVTDVIRGDDLLDSTPRQIVLYEALKLGPPPTYCHLPLVIGTDGRRLAKRHGDTRLSTYRSSDGSPRRVLAYLARCSGMSIPATLSGARDLLSGFDLSQVPHEPVVFHDEDLPRMP